MFSVSCLQEALLCISCSGGPVVLSRAKTSLLQMGIPKAFPLSIILEMHILESP